MARLARQKCSTFQKERWRSAKNHNAFLSIPWRRNCATRSELCSFWNIYHIILIFFTIENEAFIAKSSRMTYPCNTIRVATKNEAKQTIETCIGFVAHPRGPSSIPGMGTNNSGLRNQNIDLGSQCRYCLWGRSSLNAELLFSPNATYEAA